MDEELVFQYLPVDLSISHPFGLLQRPGSGTAVVLLRDLQARWVLGCKSDFHPEGLGRMVGGGIDQGEHPSEAAQRELAEETGLQVDIQKIIPLVHAEITAQFPDHDSAQASVFVFYVQAQQDIQALDDIDQLLVLDDHQFNDFIKKLNNLPSDSTLAKDNPATWQDYGQVWGPIHAAAIDRARQLSL